MCQMGAEVERCRPPWRLSSLQDGDPKRGGRCSTSHKVDDDAHCDRRTPGCAAVHGGRRRHPGTVAIEFSGETGSDDQFAHEQAPPFTSQSSRSHVSHTMGSPHDRCDDGTDASHFPCTRRSLHQFGLSWHQFVMGGTVENSIRDGNDLLVMKDETEDMCRVTESIQKQHGKISKPTSHFTSPRNMVTINHQDTIVGQDNDHLHLTDSHFSQDDQERDNPSPHPWGPGTPGSSALRNSRPQGPCVGDVHRTMRRTLLHPSEAPCRLPRPPTSATPRRSDS